MNIEILRHYSPELGRDIKVALDADNTDTYRDGFRDGFPFPEALRFLLDDRRGVARFVDVGAGIGQLTVVAGALGLETLAVEPEPTNYLMLTEAIRANGFAEVKALHAAASDETAVLNLLGESAWARLSPLAHETETPTSRFTVLALPLDTLLPLCGFGRPDLIKIDVEGHELRVIRGLQRTIRAARPLLVIESNSFTLGGLGPTRILLEAVEELGYDLFLFLPDGSVTRRPASVVQPTVVADYLAVPHAGREGRALPQICEFTVEDELGVIDLEPLDNPSHALHVIHVLPGLEERGASAERVASVQARIVENPSALAWLRGHWEGELPIWLSRPRLRDRLLDACGRTGLGRLR